MGACYGPDMTSTGMPRAILTAVLEPPPGYGPLGWALVGVAALPLVLLPLVDPDLRSPGYLAMAAATLAAVVWLARAGFLKARIELRADPAEGMLRLRAPLFSREVPLASLAAVDVLDDVDRGTSYINWPVSGRARSRRGVRLDLGGAAALVLTTHDGRRFTVVTADRAAAEELRTMVTRAASDAEDGSRRAGSA